MTHVWLSTETLGLIFVQRDIVRGLTTAAAIWLTAAVGVACGAGLPVLALYVAGAHLRLRGRGNFDSLAIAMRDLRGIISVQRVATTASQD